MMTAFNNDPMLLLFRMMARLLLVVTLNHRLYRWAAPRNVLGNVVMLNLFQHLLLNMLSSRSVSVRDISCVAIPRTKTLRGDGKRQKAVEILK